MKEACRQNGEPEFKYIAISYMAFSRVAKKAQGEGVSKQTQPLYHTQ